MARYTKLVFLLMVSALLMTMTFTGPASADKVVTLKIHTVAPKDHFVGIAIAVAAGTARELSEGTLILKPYYFAQLGAEREAVEGLQLGTIHCGFFSDGIMGAFMPEWRFAALPFLVGNHEQFRQLFDHPVLGKNLREAGERKGLKILNARSWAFRYVTNNIRPITSPASFKGIKMRTMENPVQMDTMKTLGASATPLPFPEVYTGLQTGVIEGQMNEYGAIYARKFYEVQKYMTTMPTFICSGQMMVSKNTWDSLSPKHQDILKKAVDACQAYTVYAADEAEANYKRLLAESGKIKMNTLPKAQYANFRKVLRPVYEKLAKQYPETVPFINYFLPKEDRF